MGNKLKNVLAIIIFMCNGCATPQKNKNDFFVSKSSFISAYKVSFFCGCVNAATSENLTKFMLENKDVGVFSESELISHQKVSEADSLGRQYSKKIMAINYLDADFKKPIITNCMYFALSKEIDKVAKRNYKSIKAN